MIDKVPQSDPNKWLLELTLEEMKAQSQEIQKLKGKIEEV